MKSFFELNESVKSSQKEAIIEIVSSLRDVFKEFSLHAREKAWKKLTSENGLKKIETLLKNPNHSLSIFRSL